jgi:hypothetical protein
MIPGGPVKHKISHYSSTVGQRGAGRHKRLNSNSALRLRNSIVLGRLGGIGLNCDRILSASRGTPCSKMA